MRSSAVIASVLLALILAGCSALPLPMNIDLREQLGESVRGTFSEPITAGQVDDIDLRHPPGGGECLSFEEIEIPVTVQRVRLEYRVALAYDGPPLTGRFSARLHLSDELGDLWEDANRVGPPIELELAGGEETLAGTLVLNRDQVRGVNERSLCWGASITGEDVSATGSGDATFHYDVERLMLRIRFSVI